MSVPRAVLVFARVPRLGAVKTRLAARVGEAEALRVHRVLLERAVLLAASVPGARVELWIAGEDTEGECAVLAERVGARLMHQSGGDLGARMHAALAASLRARRLPVLIGCDCPPMACADIEAAFDALADVDAVFAPTEDGGYALAGIARELPGIFHGPTWGAADVMAETRRLLRAQAIRWHETRTLWDLDDAAGHQRWLRDPGAR